MRGQQPGRREAVEKNIRDALGSSPLGQAIVEGLRLSQDDASAARDSVGKATLGVAGVQKTLLELKVLLFGNMPDEEIRELYPNGFIAGVMNDQYSTDKTLEALLGRNRERLRSMVNDNLATTRESIVYALLTLQFSPQTTEDFKHSVLERGVHSAKEILTALSTNRDIVKWEIAKYVPGVVPQDQVAQKSEELMQKAAYLLKAIDFDTLAKTHETGDT